jgi:hypothetical protein
MRFTHQLQLGFQPVDAVLIGSWGLQKACVQLIDGAYRSSSSISMKIDEAPLQRLQQLLVGRNSEDWRIESLSFFTQL